jgi:hypothetical protein
MNNTLRHALREAAGIAGDGVRFYAGAFALPVLLPVAAAGVATLSAAALGYTIADTTGRAILSELRRRARLRAPHPDSPSLRGRPTAKELADDAAEHPRTLAIRLRLGSRLADLAPTLDSGNHYDISSTGAKRIRGRGRGMRGWLADNRVPLNYSTLMRYMRLAVRLRALLELDARLPLEWLLPGATPTELPHDLQSQHAAAKRRLARLLRNHWNFSRLQRHVDEALGLRHLPRPRRTASARQDEVPPANTRCELAGFPREGKLPPRPAALHLAAVAPPLPSR